MRSYKPMPISYKTINCGLKMLSFKTNNRKVENLLGSYDLLEKRIRKSSYRTIKAVLISCQYLDHSPEDKREIKH